MLHARANRGEFETMIPLLNRICRGIEDAWTSGFIQVFIVAILAYVAINGVLSARDQAKMSAGIEQQYNREHHTNIHLYGSESAQFNLATALWDEALPIILMSLIIAYEVRRRMKLRAAKSK